MALLAGSRGGSGVFNRIRRQCLQREPYRVSENGTEGFSECCGVGGTGRRRACHPGISEWSEISGGSFAGIGNRTNTNCG